MNAQAYGIAWKPDSMLKAEAGTPEGSVPKVRSTFSCCHLVTTETHSPSTKPRSTSTFLKLILHKRTFLPCPLRRSSRQTMRLAQ